MVINDLDRPVLRAFLEREAKDFTPNKGPEWVGIRIVKIDQAIKDIDGWTLSILRTGNTGVKLSQLDLDTSTAKGNHRKSVVVTLCACGSDECWGSIREETK